MIHENSFWMGLFFWMLIGLAVAFINQWVMPIKFMGKSLVWSMILAILGAELGGFMGWYIKTDNANMLSLPSILISIAGAMLALFIYRRMAIS